MVHGDSFVEYYFSSFEIRRALVISLAICSFDLKIRHELEYKVKVESLKSLCIDTVSIFLSFRALFHAL